MLDSSGNVILYESQRSQPVQGDGKRGMISQLIEKVRTKEDRKKSPEDRERGQIPRERSKSDGRAEIIRAKAALEEMQQTTVQRQPAGVAKMKGTWTVFGFLSKLHIFLFLIFSEKRAKVRTRR